MSEVAHDYETDLLRQYENWGVYLHENQTYLGRTYIALARDGEVDPFTDTTVNEQSELLVVVNGLKTALDRLYQPDLLNYANLRNTWNHCHWHVVPRYATERTIMGHVFEDPNWGKNYAPYPNAELPPEVYEKVKTDLSTELSTS
jgi:diadenosine tetraphosphate (Ap4A) HIT family hydrolase